MAPATRKARDVLVGRVLVRLREIGVERCARPGDRCAVAGSRAQPLVSLAHGALRTCSRHARSYGLTVASVDPSCPDVRALSAARFAVVLRAWAMSGFGPVSPGVFAPATALRAIVPIGAGLALDGELGVLLALPMYTYSVDHGDIVDRVELVAVSARFGLRYALP